MSNFSGMDVEAVEGLAQRLQQEAALIDGIVAVVDAAAAALAGLWFGENFGHFHASWHGNQRGQALAASADIHAAITNLRVQADQQRIASGEGGGRSGSGPSWWRNNPVGIAGVVGFGGSVFQTFSEAWGRSDPIRTPADIVKDMVKYGADRRFGDILTDKTIEEGLVPSKTLRVVDKFLGPIGDVMDGAAIGQAYASGDRGAETTSTISGALDVVAAVPGGQPIAIAGNAALLYGSTVLPTDQKGYDGTYDLAMRTEFGPSYDPNNLTEAQAQWGVQRYEGPMGVLNSISDGMNYKAAQFGNWVGGLFGG